MNKGKILVVDDDAFFRTLASDILKNGGYSVKTASSGREALSLIENEGFDVVLTDLVMPDMDGMAVLEKTKQHDIFIDVIMVTGHGTIETAITAMRSGASDYIRKPLHEDELLLTVASCIEKKKLLEENQEMKQSLQLFEISRSIVSTIDIEKLYQVCLEAMLQMFPAEAGIMMFYDDSADGLDIKAVRHLNITGAEKMTAAFKQGYESSLKETTAITVIPKEELSARTPGVFDPYGAMVVAPLVTFKGTAGYLVVLSRNSRDMIGARELKNAAFLIEHASAAFENAQKFNQAKEMAFIDSLTNLYNSKYLEMALDKEIKRASRLMMPVTVLFLDLDNFKRINDTNDHIVGSKVLVEVAHIIKQCVRDFDTVIRYGGDEYVVILVDADYNVGYKVADRIRLTIEKMRFLLSEGFDIHVTASIGIATYPVHTTDKQELLKLADKAMYRAKDISRNVVFLAPVPEGAD